MDKGLPPHLPIWATYMKKVYDDPTLGYSQTETFKLPKVLILVPVPETPDGEVFEETGLDDLFN